MIAVSLADNKLTFTGELDLHELLDLGEEDRRVEGVAYRIQKHMADTPGDPALEIILSVKWAELDR
jgi:hypothetical protein